MQKLTERLAEDLSKYDNVKLCLNDPVQSIGTKYNNQEKSMSLTSKSSKQDFDIIISSVYSKRNIYHIFII